MLLVLRWQQSNLLRVVSLLALRLFNQLSLEYEQSVLKSKAREPAVIIEAYEVNSWERCTNSTLFMRRFGKSLPSETANNYFSFEPYTTALKIHGLVVRSCRNSEGRFLGFKWTSKSEHCSPGPLKKGGEVRVCVILSTFDYLQGMYGNGSMLPGQLCTNDNPCTKLQHSMRLPPVLAN